MFGYRKENGRKENGKKENEWKENRRKSRVICMLFGLRENRWKENKEKIFFCLDGKKSEKKENYDSIKLH